MAAFRNAVFQVLLVVKDADPFAKNVRFLTPAAMLIAGH